MPRIPWTVWARVVILRWLTRLAFALHNRARPHSQAPTYSKWINSSQRSSSSSRSSRNSPIYSIFISGRNDQIRLDIWEPSASCTSSKTRRPCVIVFHGGGFAIGQATDDSRWANGLCLDIGALVIGVNYRLAPEHPFPTPVYDCADAIQHVWDEAEGYGIDKGKIVLSGFSAGGNLAFTSWLLLRQRRRRRASPDRPGQEHCGSDEPVIRGIVGFYPSLDYSIPREEKRARSIRPDLTLPESLTTLFDRSYLPKGRFDPTYQSNPLLSPALADDETILDLPDLHLCACEYDMLLKETEGFRDRKERLESLRPPTHRDSSSVGGGVADAVGGGDVEETGASGGNQGRRRRSMVEWRVVRGAKHGFDKPPPIRPSQVAAQEYQAAMDSIRGWLKGR